MRLLESAGCSFFREGKGDHSLYVCFVEGKKIVVPSDMGAGELSPAYVLRIPRQIRFTDYEIEQLLKGK